MILATNDRRLNNITNRLKNYLNRTINQTLGVFEELNHPIDHIEWKSGKLNKDMTDKMDSLSKGINSGLEKINSNH